jgi:hypothetical protein
MQKVNAIQPRVLNLDSAFDELKPDESPFIKDLTTDPNANPTNTGNGMNNPTGEGQNYLALTPYRGTTPIANAALPAGYNKNIGSAFFEPTNELYSFNYNASSPGVYVFNGDTMQWSTIIVDPKLAFTDDPKGFIAPHRCRIRVVRDSSGNIIEKYLIFTDGINWQYFLIVNAMVATGGFNAAQYPYFTLLQPLYDRQELFQLAPRPCMQKPIVTADPYSAADLALVNRVVDNSFQFSIVYQYTDGRTTTYGVYSNPFIVKSESFLNNPNYVTKSGTLEFYAGSCMVEKIFIYIRQCGGNWALYDTIYKFSNSQTDSNNVIGTHFWTRTGQWSEYEYDSVYNTIEYPFDFSKVSQIIDQADSIRLQNDLPQVSEAVTDGGDALILANNRYDYNNFDPSTISKFGLSAVEQATSGCSIPNRNIKLYAYCGRPGSRLSWESQVGYYNGAATQELFGGLQLGPAGVAEVNITESNFFKLNFADQTAFTCYLKGTPYVAVGTWYQVNADNSLVELTGLLDFSDTDILTYVQNVFLALGYFVCVFDFEVPAGRYIATLGRHNVASTEDFIDTSTYVIGIANSRNKTLGAFPGGVINYIAPNEPGTIVSYSKEQEIDCTAGDVDVWGNGADLFYIFCPYENNSGYRFIEGYFDESINNPVAVENFPYTMTEGPNTTGQITDKNGFYFGYYAGSHADVCDIYFSVKLNCAYPVNFNIPTSQSGAGYCVNGLSYLSDHNNGVVGDCNRILVAISVTSLDGTIPYSNIAVSIVGGQTVYTSGTGKATLIVHNGTSGPRVSNIYVNAGGNFLITIADCGYLPIYPFNSDLAPCVNCNARNYPFPINLAIAVQTFETTSVKEGGSYVVGCYGADKAGRLMPVNDLGQLNIPTFMQREDTSPMSIVVNILASLQLQNVNPDLAYLIFCCSKDQTKKPGWLQWVADTIKYVDSEGNVVSNPASAVFISMSIQSLYNANVAKNFSTLANYQFKSGDRVRIIDDGNGNILTSAQYGAPLDMMILGNTYNEAAITANLLPNPSTVPVVNLQNTVNNTVNTTSGTTATQSVATQQNNTNITIYVAYDPRLDAFIQNTGLWIELYSPAQVSDEIPYCETNIFPIVNGEIGKFNGNDVNGNGTFEYPTAITLDFWDTYFLSRNITIPDVGSKYFSHPFESPNISDLFGPNCSSCGRQNFKDDNIKQQFYPLDAIKGDDFVSEGILNGLATFREANRKSFAQGYLWGGIVACWTQGSVIIFICENNSFATNFNFQYIYANNQGVQVANLDNQISDPMQKIARGYGAALEDTCSILFFDRYAFLYDYKNEAFILDDYKSGLDITKFMVKSYFKMKSRFKAAWNAAATSSAHLIDTIVGVDGANDKVYVTFRARQNNSNSPFSFINNKRNVQTNASETIVYSITTQRWTQFVGFTPESYGVLKGKNSGLQLVSFAAGQAYQHNTANSGFCQYYGQQVTPWIIAVFNEDKSIEKIMENVSLDINPFNFYADQIYSDVKWSFSYIPSNYFRKKLNQWYAPLLGNMHSYKNPDPLQVFRSTLIDGKRMRGKYFVVRLGCPADNVGNYFQFSIIFALMTATYPNKK